LAQAHFAQLQRRRGEIAESDEAIAEDRRAAHGLERLFRACGRPS
jgi:hypothetical protein